MSALKLRVHDTWLLAALLGVAALASGNALAADLYSAAVEDPGRSPADRFVMVFHKR